VRVLKEKKDYFLRYPALAAAGTPVARQWDPFVSVLDAIVNSDLSDLEKLKMLDTKKFRAEGGAKIAAALRDVTEASNELQKAGLKPAGLAPPELPGGDLVEFTRLAPSDIKVTTISQDGDVAKLRIELGSKTEEKDWTMVDGKWLPAEMVKDWDAQIEKANAWTAGEMKQQLVAAKGQVSFFLLPINATFDQLLAAQNQQQFNQVLDGIAQQVGGLMGGALGPADNP
jgi:hypothetical protein